ncbi:siphovirus Gp157 family protein, partial [Furfurilactobacillus entadae]|uniref:siphovirus Gp157 family protein n=2 Tax=Furfurilactobacillus entadae TaxID=2922307 RepID=UPI0038B3CA2F
MATMYELTNSYQQVLALLEESDDQQVIQDTLESIQGGIEDKGVSYGIVAKELDGRIDMADKEIKRLQAYRKRLAGNKKHMSQSLLNSMNVANITAIENVKATSKIRKNPVKMVV